MGFSKSQCMAVTGAVVTLTGGIILGAFNGMQNFVLGEMEGVQACTDNPIGKVGLFKSTLDFACTQTDGVPNLIQTQYASQQGLDSVPTIEYWPLFPSPNVFGFSEELQKGIMAIQNLPNLDFDTCEKYHKADNQTTQSGGGKGWKAIQGYSIIVTQSSFASFASFTELVPGLNYSDFADPSQNQQLCGALATIANQTTTICQNVTTFPSLVELIKQIAPQLQPVLDSNPDIQKQLDQLIAFNDMFAAPCVSNSITAVETCKENFMNMSPFQQTQMRAIYDGLMSVTNTKSVYDSQIYVDKCNDQLKDQNAVEKGQILVPIGTAVSLLGALVMFFGAAKCAKTALYAGSLLGIVGAILGLVALLGVKGAPVYALVGKPAAQFDIIYKSGTGSLLSLIGVALGFLGPVTATASACLMKADTADNEVDPIEKVNSKV